ncbi:MAG TPA: hypothetical protein VKB88_45725 [Bryobacteraceae bacterium]|nr:hypothetical protein [Bryobacteraceae bacterium]
MAAAGQYNVLTFHGDRQRTGWISAETILTPRSASAGAFGPLWDSPQLNSRMVKIEERFLFQALASAARD